MIKAYKKMLQKAHVSKAHVPYIEESGKSDKLFEERHKILSSKKSSEVTGKDTYMMGYASKELYTETMDSWKFDEFSRHIKPKKLSESTAVEDFLKGVKPSDKQKIDIDKKKSPIKKTESTYEAMERRNKLQAKLARIGYKPVLTTPPGLAPQIAPQLNSEGNHNFVNYDGKWLNGKMHGTGSYTFFNGATYEGSWRDGNRHGEGLFRFFVCLISANK